VSQDASSREVSRILRAAANGGPVYDRLRAIAARRMEKERPGHTLGPTALVHEAYLRLVGSGPMTWSCKAHFYAAAAEAMRRILVEHARRRDSQKRGGGAVRLPLDVLDLAIREDRSEILAVDEALLRLEKQDARMAQIVKLRFFTGLAEDEIAQALDVGLRTVCREWAVARAFLQRELSNG
jgi:RNA polymerase sigma factor (TIGR02999 family)